MLKLQSQIPEIKNFAMDEKIAMAFEDLHNSPLSFNHFPGCDKLVIPDCNEVDAFRYRRKI
jgi:hypothetical protein